MIILPKPAVTASLVLLAAALLPVPAFARNEPCKAPEEGEQLPQGELGNKLENCGSVLKPSDSADRDIVKPAPHVDDPLSIHPDQVDPQQDQPD